MSIMPKEASIVTIRFQLDESGKEYTEQSIDRQVADNVLLYQRTSGGWPKNYYRHEC